MESKNKFSFQRNIAIIGFLIFLIKIWAWRITDSNAIFSDAMESIVNIIAAFMGLYSLYVASKPRDSDHPYGHGKVEFVTSGIEGVLITIAGILIIIESISSFINGNTLKDLNSGILIIITTAVLNYIMGYVSYRKGIKENSLVLQSSGKHLQSDTVSTVGVVISLIVVNLTQWYWLDTIIAAFFGTYIIWVGYKIIRKALSGIMDEADQSIITKFSEILEEKRRPEWIDIHNIKIQQFGSTLHIDGHITLPWYFELRQAHNEMEIAIKTIVQNTDRMVEFNFHMDDCKPFSCEICQLSNCSFREKEFKQKIIWSVETITQANKHKL